MLQLLKRNWEYLGCSYVISQLDLIVAAQNKTLKHCKINLCYFQFSPLFIAQELILRYSQNGIWQYLTKSRFKLPPLSYTKELISFRSSQLLISTTGYELQHKLKEMRNLNKGTSFANKKETKLSVPQGY